jgi:fluoride exporter
MGMLVGILGRAAPVLGEDVRLLAGVGVLGGFTTFSAFSLDTVVLIERGDYLLAGLYALGSVLLAVAGLAGGLAVTRLVLA